MTHNQDTRDSIEAATGLNATTLLAQLADQGLTVVTAGDVPGPVPARGGVETIAHADRYWAAIAHDHAQQRPDAVLRLVEEELGQRIDSLDLLERAVAAEARVEVLTQRLARVEAVVVDWENAPLPGSAWPYVHHWLRDTRAALADPAEVTP